jgi:hypothetical protein
MKMHFFDVEMDGTLNTDVTIRDAHEAIVVSKPTNATYQQSRQYAGDSAFEDALNGVLTEYIRGFSRDPDILQALKGEKPQDRFSDEKK